MHEKSFDFIVVGGGSAGYAAARTFHEVGGKVAMVDGAQQLGGLCILRGCMPSKTLIYSAEALHFARQGNVFGFSAGSPEADLSAMQERKKKVIAEFADYRRGQIEDGRFELFREQASFFDSHTLVLSDGQRLRGEKILLATGSEVSVPPIPGLAEVAYKTSDDVLELSEVPPECLVLGGGVVACELTQFLSRVGSRVTILQRSHRLLKEFPKESSMAVEEAMRAEGVEILTGVSLQSFEQLAEEKVRVSYEHEEEGRNRETEFLFLALGRRPATRGLASDKIGLELLPSGHVRTNEFQQTSLPHVYAAGDCSGPHEIVHVAIRQGETAAFHALGKTVEPMNYDHLLTVVFTDPQVARVGLSPEQLHARGIDFLSASYPFDDHGKSILMEAKHGYVAVHAEKSTGRVLGAECAGKDAGELIHSLSLAVSLEATVHALIKADWYHPTLSEIWTYPLEDLAEEMPSPV